MNKYVSVWLIIPQTNLHVGNESVVSFGVIDKAIQRNVTSLLPCINSSSLKGAIKEYLTYQVGEDMAGKDQIKKLFGSIKAESNDVQKGSVCFFDADLLAIPKPCVNGNNVYELVYSDKVLTNFENKVNVLGGNLQNTKNHFDNDSKSIGFAEFEKLCSDNELPIIARNCLDNGESVNLWYEQVLPAQSVLGTIIITEGKNDLDELNGKIVQIGANATIGYGYCKFVKL